MIKYLFIGSMLVSMLFAGHLAMAQTTTNTSTTPGTPNTGAGSNAPMNAVLLIVAGAIVGIGVRSVAKGLSRSR